MSVGFKLNLSIDSATEVFQSLGSRPEPFRKALSQTRLQLAVNPAQDSNATLTSLAAKGVRDSKTDFLNTVASLPPLQTALLRELAADSLLGPDVRRPGLFSIRLKTNSFGVAGGKGPGLKWRSIAIPVSE